MKQRNPNAPVAVPAGRRIRSNANKWQSFEQNRGYMKQRYMSGIAVQLLTHRVNDSLRQIAPQFHYQPGISSGCNTMPVRQLSLSCHACVSGLSRAMLACQVSLVPCLCVESLLCHACVPSFPCPQDMTLGCCAIVCIMRPLGLMHLLTSNRILLFHFACSWANCEAVAPCWHPRGAGSPYCHMHCLSEDMMCHCIHVPHIHIAFL